MPGFIISVLNTSTADSFVDRIKQSFAFSVKQKQTQNQSNKQNSHTHTHKPKRKLERAQPSEMASPAISEG